MKRIIAITLCLFTAFALVACSATVVECPSCKAQCAPDTAFCSSCGASLARSCASCGYKCDPDASFCSSCGKPLDNANDGGNGNESVEDGRGDATDISQSASQPEESAEASTPVSEPEESEPEVIETAPSEIWLLVREEINKNAVFEYEYDYHGRTIVSEMRPYDDEDVVLIKTDYTYDENGYLKSSTTKNDLFNTNSSFTYKIETVETPKGERVSAEIEIDANGNESSKIVNGYNESGQLIKKEEYYGTTLYMSYEYDPKTEKVLKEYDANGNISKENIYNDKGQLVEEKTYTNGELLMRATFTFDNNGNPAKRTGVREDDGSVVESYYVYKSLERYRLENGLKP